MRMHYFPDQLVLQKVETLTVANNVVQNGAPLLISTNESCEAMKVHNLARKPPENEQKRERNVSGRINEPQLTRTQQCSNNE